MIDGAEDTPKGEVTHFENPKKRRAREQRDEKNRRMREGQGKRRLFQA
jgi:hypothetical protein